MTAGARLRLGRSRSQLPGRVTWENTRRPRGTCARGERGGRPRAAASERHRRACRGRPVYWAAATGSGRCWQLRRQPSQQLVLLATAGAENSRNCATDCRVWARAVKHRSAGAFNLNRRSRPTGLPRKKRSLDGMEIARGNVPWMSSGADRSRRAWTRKYSLPSAES